MLINLLVDGGKGRQFFVTGRTMLMLADQAVDEFVAQAKTQINGDGSYKQPYVLGGKPADWLLMLPLMRKYVGVDLFFEICGRYVQKIGAGYYMVDDGGKGKGRAWDQPYVRRTDRIGDYAESSGKFERGGPSYGQYMKRLSDQQRHSSKNITSETWAQHKATKLRKVLKADTYYASKLAYKGDLHTGQLLPVLAATIFLAEPARNERGFLINLFLLDLIELGPGTALQPYTWDRVMWNPEFDDKKGGLLPAARTGSASAAKIGSVLNKTQEMELDVLLQIFSFNDFKGTTLTAPPKDYVRCESDKTVPICSMPDRSKPNDLMGYLKYLMYQRLVGGFDY